MSLGQGLHRIQRGLRRRCPNCGSGGIFRRWLILERYCPGCHLKLDRGEGDHFLGAYTLNFVAAEILLVVAGGGAIAWTWPSVPWDGILWGLAALMILAPIALYPVARSVWLAIDLTFRPLTLSDLEAHGENRV